MISAILDPDAAIWVQYEDLNLVDYVRVLESRDV